MERNASACRQGGLKWLGLAEIPATGGEPGLQIRQRPGCGAGASDFIQPSPQTRCRNGRHGNAC